MGVFMRLLLAVDDSDYSQAAVEQVGTHFNPQTTEIKMLHVMPPASYSSPPQMARGYAPEMEELEKNARSNLDKLAKKLRNVGFAVDAAVEKGEVRSTILDSATDYRADLILVGSHGHTGLERLLLGSVAESVVRHARCSVLVVRKKPLNSPSN
jgi:universal stress protein A